MKTLQNKVITFLNEIGIETYIVEDLQKLYTSDKIKPFVKDIIIKEGKLICDRNVKISSLLHEAGHLAVLHPNYRKFASGNIFSVEVSRLMFIGVLV